MARPIRVLNAWSHTGDVIAPLLARAGHEVEIVRVDSPTAAAIAARRACFDVCVAELAHAGGGAAVLDAVSRVPSPPSGLFVNASPLGLRHGVASHARGGLTLPFRLIDLLHVVEALVALHRAEPHERPLCPLSQLTDTPDHFAALAGPSVLIDCARAEIARHGGDETPVCVIGGCATARRAAARLLHAQRGAGHFCVIGPGDGEDVWAAWQLTGRGTLFVEDLERWSFAQRARLTRCLERAGPGGPRLVAGSLEVPTGVGLFGRADGSHAVIAVPPLAHRRADLFALIEARLCRGPRPRWLSGVELAALLNDAWIDRGLADLDARLGIAPQAEARSPARSALAG